MAMNITAPANVSSSPSLPPGLGGTCTNSWRPSQKKKVAMAIRMPGIPNASETRQNSLPSPRIQGISRVAKNEPKLMLK